MFGNCQTQAGAAFAARWIPAVEALKDAQQLQWRNAAATIDHTQH